MTHDANAVAPTMTVNRGGGVFAITADAAMPAPLPLGVYTVGYSEMSGHFITTLPNIAPPEHNVYGRRDEKIEKILNTYSKMSRSLGVLFKGDKGIGKSSTTVELARQAQLRFGLPVIMVTQNLPGIAEYLGSFGEVVVIFDEFEKRFPREVAVDEDGAETGTRVDAQSQFLSLLDGTNQTKRLYVVTVNETSRLSPFFLNRPGRFHYLIDFDYPNAEEIVEYLNGEASGASELQRRQVALFALGAKLNYDHLRAIALELEIAGSEAPVSELLEDLNIESNSASFDVKVIFENGSTVMPRLRVDWFTQGTCKLVTEVYSPSSDSSSFSSRPLGRLDLSYTPGAGVLTGNTVVVDRSQIASAVWLTRSGYDRDDFNEETEAAAAATALTDKWTPVPGTRIRFGKTHLEHDLLSDDPKAFVNTDAELAGYAPVRLEITRTVRDKYRFNIENGDGDIDIDIDIDIEGNGNGKHRGQRQ